MPAKPWSKTWTFFDGDWHEGNPLLIGPRSNAMWLASAVFDGARAFEGVTPDLDLHLARINRSAAAMGLDPVVTQDTWLELAKDGLKRFDRDAALYIRPMYWAEQSGVVPVGPDPESTRWCLCLYELPMPSEEGQAITLSPFRKPTIETAPVDAKAACLYPNNARAGLEAHKRGFDNAILLDMLEIGRPDLDWLALAKGMGVRARRVTTLDEFASALRDGLESAGPNLIEVPL